MRTVSLEKLSELQRNPRNIRNICILAHVDHGKTTLADSFISSNGIISPRLAGKLRYLDSREDEQVRGITMKASAIALNFVQEANEYLINLIDSPGHVDFSSEVSTAVRLCDGALVVVDVVEGVSPQTHVVLQQAWLEHIKPCLILNKMDRLIVELKLTTLEAYHHLQQVLEQVNAVMGNLFASHVLEKSSSDTAEVDTKPATDEELNKDMTYDWSAGLEDTDDSNIYFTPESGNVIFSSAVDGWGFGIEQFAEQYAKKLGVRSDVLKKTLWGDFYLNSKTKRIMKGAQEKGKKPLFVQFVLENIWAVYESVQIRKDKEMMEKIIKSLSLKIHPRDLRSHDPRVHLQAIFSQWLPVSRAALSMVCRQLPSPLDVDEERVENLLCSGGLRFEALPPQSQELKTAFQHPASGQDAPLIVFVSKMFAVDRSALPQNKPKPLTEQEIEQRREAARRRHAERQAGIAAGEVNARTKENEVKEQEEKNANKEDNPNSESDQIFLAFARVFSGTIRKGQKVYVLGPKHNPWDLVEQEHRSRSSENPHVHVVTVDNLYILMGRELEEVTEVPAGNVLGIGGLENIVLKSATVSSTIACPAFTDMMFAAPPIVRVAVEPRHIADMPALIQGMKLLNQADPCVNVFVQETGEHVLVAAGEVHLEKCLNDLKERFAKVEMEVSKPIVPFKETIIIPPKVDMVNEAIDDINRIQINTRGGEGYDSEDITISKDGSVEISTANKLCRFILKATPLPESVTKLLEENAELIKILDSQTSAVLSGKAHQHKQSQDLASVTLEKLLEFKSTLGKAFSESGKKWRGAVDKIWSFGPRRYGPNLLLNQVEGYDRPSIWDCLEVTEKVDIKRLRDFDGSVVSGFQLATLAGPMCEEPVMGVCYFLDKWDIDEQISCGSYSNHKKNVGHKDKEKSTLEEGNIYLEPPLEVDQKSLQAGSLKAEGQISIPGRRDMPLTCNRTLSSPPVSPPPLSPSSPSTSNLSSSWVGSPGMPSQVFQSMYGPLSGQTISTIKEGCRIAFQAQPQRLMAAMYKCNIQATAEVLGRLYAVLSKRCGRVLTEDMREGSAVFDITAVLPIAESFGFAEEIRKRTSGLASPQLFFSHWEVISSDPYWVPSTEEELLHFGEKADSDNQARKYLDNVRRRKGLYVEEKIVEHAEKQRTLSKNK